MSTLDEHTRECLGGLVERGITGEHLIAELDRLAAERGTYPVVLRCDNGPELACSAMVDWAAGGSVCISFGPVSWRNGYTNLQLPHPRRMPQHQQLLVAGPSAGSHQRLEARLQPPPAALCTRLPAPGPLRGNLYPRTNKFCSLWTVTRVRSLTYWGHPFLTVVQHRWAAKTSFQSALVAPSMNCREVSCDG